LCYQFGKYIEIGDLNYRLYAVYKIDPPLILYILYDHLFQKGFSLSN